jgi:phosphate transport system protein
VREVFHGELTQLGVQLESMCACAGQAMRQAAQALLTAELVLAERVLAGDTQLDQRRAEWPRARPHAARAASHGRP